ncbi:MAG: right-handed parallel beta-helix repeat-containing protein, partial [Acidimicrobiia bacterium]|nr:right-handed parallel beta-helix repeat-containing protein [Acidimicrobiia bacterium]
MSNRIFVLPIAVLALFAMLMAPPGGGPPGNGNGNGNGKGGSSVEFFVDATTGDDANDGSEQNPFATLERAQVEVQIGAAEQSADVIVNLSGGVHQRATTFRLTGADSGRNGFDVIYRSSPGEQAIIEGGLQLAGWQPGAGSLYEVAVPAELSDFRQFYAAGERQTRARSATASGSATQFLQELVRGSLKDAALVVPNEVLANLAHPEDLELLYIGVLVSGHGILDENGNELFRPSWRSHRLQVEQVSAYDAEHMRVDIEQDALYHASQRGYFKTFVAPQDPFYLENAIELLDEEGEWFFDTRERKLHWWPPAGVDPNQVETWVPAVETLLDVDGTPADPVERVKIEDLVFRHSTYLVTSELGYVSGQGPGWFVGWEADDWMIDNGVSHSYLSRAVPQGLPGAAVEMDSAHDVEFTGNVLTQLGAAGIILHNDVTDAVFAGNVFDDLSGSGLIAGHEEHVYIDEPMEGLIERISIENNLIARAGREYFTAVGIRIFKSADVSIVHNHFV